ncbi:ATP synthase epsilon chain [Methylopila jiangsuensis]|uniref:ATP synthase epsilon chain n=1 Tax=Methylopila jiangsuensis TaxID=586230 RepID=A0A9W6JLT8_9HYPH|nr:F0F1 ATP synthase subunit epsilon [Methylopila jiangsuensis]MDR6284737.1 F-type H+-transporting ATPase subunit epsilon [Methylopila jiangsuensis]GLK77873.1 ATP synthase epsilon chain [Methylopila jiangsuensis]
MDSFPFELVSPEKLLISEDVQHVVVPGVEGEFGVLAHHAPFMSVLKPGVVKVYKTEGGEPQKLFVRGGFADVNPKGLTILADEATPLDQLDASRIDVLIADAQEDVVEAKTDDERLKAEIRLSHFRQLKAVHG